MEKLIRSKYLDKIRPFYHDPEMIKVLTGVRRCGKSTIMKQIFNELKDEGISEKNILYIDLDSKEFYNVEDPKDLENTIEDYFKGTDGERYLFIDEIQNVKGFEKIVNAYRGEGVSTFITGSNSYLLSGELITKLTGRYIEFKIFPFSFSEVRDYSELNNKPFSPQKDFRDYITNGGFPKRFSYQDITEQEIYTKEIVSETVTKDILTSKKVKNRSLLNSTLHYIASNPSAIISSTSIVKFLKNGNVKTLPSTVNNYLDLIFASNIASKCQRFDIIGKRALKTLYKSYLADPSLYTYFPTRRQIVEMGHILENIVYNELISRGYEVYIGKMKDKEVDFIVSNGKDIAYIQVAYMLPDEGTVNREMSSLLSIRDNYPKYLMTMDPITMDRNGIAHLHIVDDFLLGDRFKLLSEI